MQPVGLTCRLSSRAGLRAPACYTLPRERHRFARLHGDGRRAQSIIKGIAPRGRAPGVPRRGMRSPRAPCAAAPIAPTKGDTMGRRYAIVGGKLIDGTGAAPVDNALVLVGEDGAIEYVGAMQDVPEGHEVIDAAGKTVMPGLIDTHLHFSGNLTDDDTDWVMQPLLEKQAVAVKQAYDCLTHGLTTVCEIGRFGIQIRDCIEKGVFRGPRVLATGLGFCRTAGHGDSHRCSQLENKESHPWGDQVDGPWDLRRAVRRRLRENPDAIKIWATGGGIWRWDSGRDQHYCADEIQAVIDEAKMVGIPVWSHCYNNHAAAYDSVRFGCEQLIHGFDIDERTMDLMAEQGTFFTPTIAFLPTWYATYPPVYVPELHDRYEGALVEKELQRNYDCLCEAKRRGVVMTIGSDSFSFVTPYGTCTIEEMYEFVDKIGFTPVEAVACATLNGAKMAHVDNVTGSLEAGKCADLLVVNGDVAANIHTLNVDNMDVIMKDGWIVEAGTFGEANRYSA